MLQNVRSHFLFFLASTVRCPAPDFMVSVVSVKGQNCWQTRIRILPVENLDTMEKIANQIVAATSSFCKTYGNLTNGIPPSPPALRAVTARFSLA
jgi:hypothetical protein